MSYRTRRMKRAQRKARKMALGLEQRPPAESAASYYARKQAAAELREIRRRQRKPRG